MIFAVAAALLLSLASIPFEQRDAALGLKGTHDAANDESAYAWSRPDEKELTAGVKLPPYLNIRCSLRFVPSAAGQDGTLEGTLVLRNDELEPLRGQATRAGFEVEVSELYFFVDPKVHSMRFTATGPMERLLRDARALLDRLEDMRAIREGAAEDMDAADPLASDPTVLRKPALRTACNCLLHLLGGAFMTQDSSPETRTRPLKDLGYSTARDEAVAKLGVTAPPDYLGIAGGFVPVDWKRDAAIASVLVEESSRVASGVFLPRLLRPAGQPR